MPVRAFTASLVALLVTVGLAVPWAHEITCESHSKRVLKSTIVFASNRDNLTLPFIEAAEIYVMDLGFDMDGKPTLGPPRRLTNNLDRDTLPALSPDGKGTIVFDSNRVRKTASPPEPTSSDLFLIKNGQLPMFLTRGSSATWSPNGKRIAFHRSASDTFVPPEGNPSPGAPTDDSDIFVLKVHRGTDGPKNLTFEEPDDRLYINEDADWSPDGKRIAFARRSVLDNNFPANSGDIWVMNADGKDKIQLTGLSTQAKFEDKGPAWSPDGRFIAYSCRYGPLLTDRPEICVTDLKDVKHPWDSIPAPTRLTNTAEGELGTHWIPSRYGNGNKILYQRPLVQMQGQQIWLMDLEKFDSAGFPVTMQLTGLTSAEGTNQFPNWGVIKTKCGDDDDDDDEEDERH
ncbi:MAG TPA: hypothetical protein VMS40_13065, partial [Vicinamibacterales bacterium]|nr:hypothetical protein [Vicinamibacterales bacterium]